MSLDLFVMWAVVGLAAGWVAGSVMKRGGYGLMGDLALGLAGSVAASTLFRILGFSPEAGLLALIAVAFLGAAATLVAQRQFWQAPV
jgi:uncharacterized membrane protein YeaQ/YmgE (transglycosylase-associated protein family)